MSSDPGGAPPVWSRWIPVPLRLFLGVTFLYAGIQKLTDPQYLNPGARGYIGHQMAAFAAASPLHEFLLGVAVPHAALFGVLVAYGELAIGLSVLLGLLLRVAALFGLLLNLLFFLSADWQIFPYFYGSDIVFLFCWLTLLIAGPAQQALPALDPWLVRWLADHTRLTQRPRLLALCQMLGGRAGTSTGQRAVQRAGAAGPAHRASRRTFLWGAASGGTLMLALLWLREVLHLWPVVGDGIAESGTQVTPTLGSPVAEATPTAALPGRVIARIGDVPPNSASTFTIPSTSAPGILVHLGNRIFVAFNATCTHAGCPVDYDPALRDLVCPCHGAAFDPSQGAAVINGPAQLPLSGVPIVVDHNAGTVSLAR